MHGNNKQTTNLFVCEFDTHTLEYIGVFKEQLWAKFEKLGPM